MTTYRCGRCRELFAAASLTGQPVCGRCRVKRRLKNVRVDEISFVDKPAVPTATFALVKRLDPAAAERARLVAAVASFTPAEQEALARSLQRVHSKVLSVQTTLCMMETRDAMRRLKAAFQ